ncbi:MAG: hypothetical protein J7K40_09410 [candidate division Zixibacteria bacterium]|nr:hypothetical protein [candidate division Zixibacteria bacterium]
MADTVTSQWLYPPNWDETPPSSGGVKRIIKRFTCVSDGTGESNALKIDISELRTTLGRPAVRTVIEKIIYAQTGFANVRLTWDRNPAVTICLLLHRNGIMDFKPGGGLVDPGEEGDETGDILLTSTGADSGDAYDITITLRLKDK